MITPNQLLLYVDNPAESTLFYEKIFEIKPVAAYPNYVAFSFDNGFYFCLWSTKARNFVSGGEGHRSELSFMLKEEQEVRDLYSKWKSLGVIIEQEPHEAVFGLTFVALDPDGHRIRVCMFDK